MRRIIESSFVTLDGVIGDPRSWAGSYFDPDAQAEALEELLASDAMLMGRGTYEYFAPAWPALSGPYAERINTMPKLVFSSTLDAVEWNNARIVRGDVVAEVTQLKHQDGRDLVIYGHGELAQTLLEHNLLDELRLAIYPILAGHGQQLFREGRNATLQLVGTKARTTGVVVVTYRPAV